MKPISEWSKARIVAAVRTWGWRRARAERTVRYLVGRKTSLKPRTGLTPQRKVYLLRVWRRQLSQARRMETVFRNELARRRTVVIPREKVPYPSVKPFTYSKWGRVKLVLHHTVTSSNMEPREGARFIDRLHRGRGFNGIGYHLLVFRDGSIVEGRPPHSVGAHAGTNTGNRWPGVALVGDYRRDTVTPAQAAALDWIEKEYLPNLGATVVGRTPHSALYPTSCPGPNALRYAR